MGRKPRVDRIPDEKWQIVQEGLKSGNVSETCRRHGIAHTARGAQCCSRGKSEAGLSHGFAGAGLEACE